ncbi:MAG: glycoside hydrolase family 16 protein [Bacteroidota bacterium]
MYVCGIEIYHEHRLPTMKKPFLKTLLPAIALCASFWLTSCGDAEDVLPASEYQEIPVVEAEKPADELMGRKTNTNTGTRIIEFSGYRWIVRNSTTYTGPGLNVFSNSVNNVWVDGLGQLHLKLTYTNGKWQSAEVLSEQNFGYGEYVFYTATKADQLDKNVVYGLFTWDDNTFKSDANSEIDVEFAKWGYATAPSLQYSVQPTNGGIYPERDINPSGFLLTGDYSTHGFTWSPTDVIFKSYYDHGWPTAWLAGEWSFLSTVTARQKIQGSMTSDPVIIPRPGTTTKVHINLWLNDSNFDGYGDAPSNGQTAEVIVKKFTFKARTAI